MDVHQYYNELLYRLEELFYHELSDCAGWKTEYIGIDFIQAKGIHGSDEGEIIVACIEGIVGAGLVQDMSYEIAGKGVLLALTVSGCRHIPKEVMLRKSGIQPYNCPIANMILDQLIEKLGYTTTYVADLAVDEKAGKCVIKAAIYATPEMIGVVSDWAAEQS
jgi:hypothetical protein